MSQLVSYIGRSLILLAVGVALCCGAYPFLVWCVGQIAFPFQANGSLVRSRGQVVGSRLIAQPFTGEGYFWPRPSAPSYDATASGASNLAASNYLLRDRVARTLGPIVRFRSGPQAGLPVAPEVERWFHEDRYQGRPGIVAQWAELHPDLASSLPSPLRSEDIRAIFFDMWRQDHPEADLESVPGDFLMASGSGLDPDITLSNARYQLPRVANQRAADSGRDVETVRAEIEQTLRQGSFAPFGGLAGEPLVNVLEMNLALDERYRTVHVDAR
jgi:K+-transporting ATPase c subunit